MTGNLISLAVMANPSYQPGLQRPQISEPLRPPAPQPYQPLIVGTRAPGVSAEYRELQIELRDDHKIGIPVDLTDYQDLDQSSQAQKYQVLVAEAAFEVKTEDIGHQIFFILDFFYVRLTPPPPPPWGLPYEKDGLFVVSLRV